VEVCAVVTHPRRSLRRIEAELWDLSEGGCRLVTREPFSPSDQLLIGIEGLEVWPARVVWVGAESVGISFYSPLHDTIVEHYARMFLCGATTEV
jgi:hypothetical protein